MKTSNKRKNYQNEESPDIFKGFLIADIINFGMLSFVLFIFCISTFRINKETYLYHNNLFHNRCIEL